MPLLNLRFLLSVVILGTPQKSEIARIDYSGPFGGLSLPANGWRLSWIAGGGFRPIFRQGRHANSSGELRELNGMVKPEVWCSGTIEAKVLKELDRLVREIKQPAPIPGIRDSCHDCVGVVVVLERHAKSGLEEVVFRSKDGPALGTLAFSAPIVHLLSQASAPLHCGELKPGKP